MRHAIISFLIFILVYFTASSDDVKDIILSTPPGRDLNVGIYVVDLDSGKVKYALHDERLFLTASTAKVFTMYTALAKLGPNYRFKTSLFSSKTNLYLKFSGDPVFTHEHLKEIIKSANLERIKGDVIVDDTLFDEHGSARGGFHWDDNNFCYAAPVNAIIVDKNCALAWMKPAGAGHTASLEIDRPYVLSIKNTVNTVFPTKRACPYKASYAGDNTYEVFGCMFNNSDTVKLNFALQDTRAMIKNYLLNIFHERGIKLDGKIKFAKLDKSARLLYTHESPSLHEIASDILTESCNISAAAVFKAIAAKVTNEQGTDEIGEEVMKSFLVSEGVPPKLFKLSDGAGGSRYTMASPKALTKVLSNAYHNKEMRAVFLEHLPQYGTKGSLKFRTIEGGCSEHVCAKTGSFQNVSSIAGYYLPPKGPKYAFAVMINNHTLPWTEIKALEDKIVERVLRP